MYELMDDLRARHTALVNNVETRFQRGLIEELPWNEPLVGIKGPRGVGKTTLLLQYIKKTYQHSNEAIYISLDDPYFYDHRLLYFADDFTARGGRHLFIDEVHKYPNWAIEIKKIYDYHPDLKVVFTGSSLLQILNARADLSRRALIYQMHGMSFREFLLFRHNIATQIFTMKDLLKDHVQIALELSGSFKPLKYFDEYLKTGYFPFYSHDNVLYQKRLQEIINMILELELPALRNIALSKVSKIKQLLSIISRSVPFKPNISKLAEKIHISRNSLLEYLHGMADAGIILNLHKASYGISLLQKPEKIYLANTNYMYALNSIAPNAGNIRETFFLSQTTARHPVTYPEKGDFMVDDKYLFEIGGKNKSKRQIAETGHSFIAADDIEFGYENKMPLWLFGFLY